MKKHFFEINRWTLFSVFGLSIFVKCVLFHYFCFNYVAVSSLWNAPHDFFSFYVAKLLPAVSIASFVFVFKRRWWIIVASIIIDLWFAANFIYYRANDLFLDTETIMIVDNLNGFWSSIVAYLNWKTIAFVVVSVILYVFLVFTKVDSNRNWKGFAVASITSLLFFVGDHFAGYSTFKTTLPTNQNGWTYSAFKSARQIASGNYFFNNFVFRQWFESQTPLHFFPAFLYKQICDFFYGPKELALSEDDKNKIEEFVNRSALDNNTVTQNLIIILGESFESWTYSMKDNNNLEVTPNMNALRKQDNSLYADKIRSQVRRGNSGDGQMIINTGLLPLESGAACMLYGENVFPNYAHKYETSAIVNPVSGIWNQKVTTYSYGYKNLEELSNPTDKWNWIEDDETMQFAVQHCKSLNQPFGTMIITVSTHSPFSSPRKSHLSFRDGTPQIVQDYLNCMHYADSCVGVFLNELAKDSLLHNTTVVITGDHTIFRSNLLAEMQPAIEKYGLPIPKDETFCPLIISSPTITKHTEIDTLCFQMDIYPTILHCLGINDYYWKGFGVNLLGSAALQNRKISEEEAFKLSNLIIRSNYFKNYSQN